MVYILKKKKKYKKVKIVLMKQKCIYGSVRIIMWVHRVLEVTVINER